MIILLNNDLMHWWRKVIKLRLQRKHLSYCRRLIKRKESILTSGSDLVWRCQSVMSQTEQSVVPESLLPHGLQHARLPCPSLTRGAFSNSSLSRQWCHPGISSSVFPFSSCLQSFPASWSFPKSQFFTSGSQSIGVSASVLPMNIQDWFPII